ncbi:hypothetical protein GLOTRDRAFT_119967 [Gloeophyllum trabeum ATCC 11539]|uniref:M-phase inducer phosphatase n=1 Tax=Gloeophyllum trabeum (strain ATCC 11539 / FP-39264 / Madison 617) TaxID=670483 RepID=S7QG07_GLOTA|nr:uncharacterized protein GLOTRDRAFT_119967 [Gloeophyllum trabeum ATCC 11539]EPQ58093.1 hypothetical protein GLOTRDRAFT_119967 [Gloeophyllum trabeum ATCC 11539]
MAFFTTSAPATQYLAASPLPSRKFSQRSQRPRDDLDEFLSSDLDMSFASTMSINSPIEHQRSLAPMDQSPIPMDISPAPARPSSPKDLIAKPLIRSLAFDNDRRLFGRDRSNSGSQLLSVPPVSKSGSTGSAKRMQRPALPSEWLFQGSGPQDSNPASPLGPSSPESEEAMDIDSCNSSFSDPLDEVAEAPLSSEPTVTQFNALFFNTTSPRRSLESPALSTRSRRRSLSPERSVNLDDLASSSPAPLHSSPSDRKFERIASAPLGKPKPSLAALGVKPRRPTISSLVTHSEQGIQSAYPALTSVDSHFAAQQASAPPPPVRRAFSAMLPPTIGNESFSDESFDGGDNDSPAHAYTQRQKTLRRRDGGEDLKTLKGVPSASPSHLQESPSARFLSAGMPGFGDNEAHGKILPCHRVREDGLMRINCQTLDALLDGAYNDKVSEFLVIDCRFDYEYNGGHIPGAINLNTTAAVEELLLGPCMNKPKPSVSGDPCKKTVLIFHCEFSVKRAPTFAKHLRSKDRALNHHVYPRIHFPEVYVLEGGYSQYYKESGARCQPCGYVRMDDPNYAASRREDIDQFRKTKFGRTKSYAFGDGFKVPSYSQQTQPKRHTAPSTGSLFGAANAARGRRTGGGLATLAEDGDTTDNAEDTDADIGDSPCPPPTKNIVMKGKKLARAPLARAETFGGSRFGY